MGFRGNSAIRYLLEAVKFSLGNEVSSKKETEL